MKYWLINESAIGDPVDAYLLIPARHNPKQIKDEDGCQYWDAPPGTISLDAKQAKFLGIDIPRESKPVFVEIEIRPQDPPPRLALKVEVTYLKRQ